MPMDCSTSPIRQWLDTVSSDIDSRATIEQVCVLPRYAVPWLKDPSPKFVQGSSCLCKILNGQGPRGFHLFREFLRPHGEENACTNPLVLVGRDFPFGAIVTATFEISYVLTVCERIADEGLNSRRMAPFIFHLTPSSLFTALLFYHPVLCSFKVSRIYFNLRSLRINFFNSFHDSL